MKSIVSIVLVVALFCVAVNVEATSSSSSSSSSSRLSSKLQLRSKVSDSCWPVLSCGTCDETCYGGTTCCNDSSLTTMEEVRAKIAITAAVAQSKARLRTPVVMKSICWEVSACWECTSGEYCSGSGDNMLCCPDARMTQSESSPAVKKVESKVGFPVAPPCNACTQQCANTFSGCMMYCDGQEGCPSECGSQYSECLAYCPSCPSTQ